MSITTQRDSDLVLLGWRGRRKRLPEYVLGSTIDYVTEHASCDVVVVKTRGPESGAHVLVPTAGGPHAELTADVSASLAAATDARITLLVVARDDQEHAERTLHEPQVSIAEAGIESGTAVVVESDVPAAIRRYAEKHDVDTIVLGAAEEGIVRRVVFGDVPERSARRSGERYSWHGDTDRSTHTSGVLGSNGSGGGPNETEPIRTLAARSYR